MELYEGTIKEFSDLVLMNQLSTELERNFKDSFGWSPSKSEIRSWENSLNFLKNVFDISGLSSNRLILEYNLPRSSGRIDALMFGKDTSKQDNIVITELKQWSNDSVKPFDIEGLVNVRYYTGWKAVSHPSIQVEGYVNYLRDFVKLFEEDHGIVLTGSSYCHNYSKKGGNNALYDQKFKEYIRKYPLFSKEDAGELSRFMSERIGNDSGEELFKRFRKSDMKPSKQLLRYVSEMIGKREIFNLIDDQIPPYNAIIQKAEEASKSGEKSVIIVKGGPGTGKSVIALETMAKLSKKGIEVYYATGSNAFTNTLRSLVGGNRGRYMFKYFYDFTKEKDNDINVIICDEAHRIRKDSADWGVPKDKKSNESQVESLIRTSKLSVFFIDEYQIVRPSEIGSVKLIKDAAEKLKVPQSNIYEFELETQFRCGGSATYLWWIENVLQIAMNEKKFLEPGDRMKFTIVDDPVRLKEIIDEKNYEKENSARIVASFCWPWSNPREDGTLVNDVVVGNLQMPWERKNAFWKWATAEEGMHQVGTVYTAQGFEFDYVGVIFGEDLYYDPGSETWKSDPKKSYDSMLKRKNKNLTHYLKNVYRVLLTRAHYGVYVYFMNKDTEDLFRSRIKQP